MVLIGGHYKLLHNNADGNILGTKFGAEVSNAVSRIPRLSLQVDCFYVLVKSKIDGY